MFARSLSNKIAVSGRFDGLVVFHVDMLFDIGENNTVNKFIS